jgi:hypothetical protein
MFIFLSLTLTFIGDLMIHWIIGCTRQHHHIFKLHLPSSLTQQECLASKLGEILSDQEGLHDELELVRVTSRQNNYINQHIYWPLNPSDLGLHTRGMYTMTCTCGQVYNGQTDPLRPLLRSTTGISTSLLSG